MEDAATIRSAHVQRTRAHLRSTSVTTSILFGIFTIHNLASFAPPASWIAAAHDLALCAALGLTGLAMRQNRVSDAWVHPLVMACTVAVASNVMLVLVLTGQRLQLLYFALIIFSVGGLIASVRWAAATLLAVGLFAAVGHVLTWPIDRALANAVFAGLAMSSVSMGVVFGRAWLTEQLDEQNHRERQRERALRTALEKARLAERQLDAKVARRTDELSWAKGALQRHVEESQRAHTEARTLSAQLRHAQRVDAMGQLTGGVAHDFNNLITAVIGNVELALLDVPRHSATADALRDARTSAVRAAELTQQLLSFGRAGDEDSQTYAIDEALDAVRRVVGRLLGEDIRLLIRAPDASLRVGMSPVQFDQILLNLAVNARDAMPLGGTLRVTAEAEGGEVHVAVSDTGSGIDHTTLEHIFDPYFTTKARGKGTGLGLATAMSIIKQHHGRITVDTEPGQGTTFHVFLPRVEAAPTAQRTSRGRHSLPPSRMPRGRGEQVLVVEDEDAVRRIAVRILERLGYRAMSASSGPEALRLLVAHPGRIDLLWTDVLMPGMDGKELADRMHDLRPETHVLFASGYSGDKLAPRGVLPSETHFLAKPYDAADIARAVRSALDA